LKLGGINAGGGMEGLGEGPLAPVNVREDPSQSSATLRFAVAGREEREDAGRGETCPPIDSID